MAGRKLTVSVFIRPEDGSEGRWYLAGDEVPAEVAKTVSNPDVWADSEPASTEDQGAAKAPAKKAAASAAGK